MKRMDGIADHPRPAYRRGSNSPEATARISVGDVVQFNPDDPRDDRGTIVGVVIKINSPRSTGVEGTFLIQCGPHHKPEERAKSSCFRIGRARWMPDGTPVPGHSGCEDTTP
jgi:hypothetical protein